ncbi:hypothetical protein Kfla_5562 [Kribbella flavida DSM 17836]|uniref:Uncharacterized protein n=1 Tax=Kribbella flavida (strain DSM 17836 / JCM 10339 / NBRC 14399) TaxID=479435 RepID=D2PN84_KRIFD|nr:hypothetical protein [Kribbella flavida]ADB34568.1 hypothetical protein Kfla_5562 [Kribbella flavida DSM 17836]
MSSTLATSTHTATTHSSGQGSGSLPLAADLTVTVHTITQAATVTLIVTGVIAFYLLTCLIWPFGRCRRCNGAGKHKSPFGKAYRYCGRCQGSGMRVRIGRHVINYIRAARGAGTNTVSKGDKK